MDISCALNSALRSAACIEYDQIGHSHHQTAVHKHQSIWP
jgi:hypothetical protein